MYFYFSVELNIIHNNISICHFKKEKDFMKTGFKFKVIRAKDHIVFFFFFFLLLSIATHPWQLAWKQIPNINFIMLPHLIPWCWKFIMNFNLQSICFHFIVLPSVIVLHVCCHLEPTVQFPFTPITAHTSLNAVSLHWNL